MLNDVVREMARGREKGARALDLYRVVSRARRLVIWFYANENVNPAHIICSLTRPKR